MYFALRLSPVDAGKYVRLAVAIAVGISIFAAVQGSFLGFSFVATYWGTPALPIPGTFVAQYLQGPRASGTLGSPNELGFALAAWALMASALLFVKPANSRWVMAALFAIIVGLALTFSRSAIIACAAGMVVLFIAGWRLSPDPRRAFGYLALALVPALVLSGAIYSERGGIRLLESTFTSLSSVSATDNGQDPNGVDLNPSTELHLNSISTGWQLVEQHPMGLGLGTVGSRGDPLSSQHPQYIFESWYLTMGVSFGWLGLVWAVFLPLAMFLTALFALRRGPSLMALSLLGLAITLAIVSYWLPTMLQPQLAMLPWSLAALVVSPISAGAPPPAPADARTAVA
jgi:hypothetical protein